ncbi:hypothetical protein ABS71_07340 [bacterium SCN 62-11]|nr:hypothetical protein [Candidatus Eremiobacteraeota bacterium]ODT73374.1 MAG: hypothetical protein ABS71_07340 [bacterium SCN 62-11]
MQAIKQELPFLLFLSLIVCSPVLAVRISPPAPPSLEDRETQVQTPAPLPEARASALARRAAPSAELLRCRLEKEEGQLVYEAVLVESHRQRSILLDARNGKIVSNRLGREQ